MTSRFDDEQQKRVDREMSLTSQFVDLLIQDESVWDEMPAGAMVFVYREGDQEGEEKERRTAEQYAKKGRPVYVRALPPAPVSPRHS